ncbi:hypothetical protein CQA15_29165, partial [Klebsiella pneumoniae]|uniref:alcohol dehydrogenase catalytic domain-containing protein n=1 Tax=Klebsiella pneumoniae TaxID=573 RepID=UPI000BD4AEDE
LDLLYGRPRIARIGYGLRRGQSGGMGLDLAGEVVEVGGGVTGLRPGDRVWADLFDQGHSTCCTADRASPASGTGSGVDSRAEWGWISRGRS